MPLSDHDIQRIAAAVAPAVWKQPITNTDPVTKRRATKPAAAWLSWPAKGIRSIQDRLGDGK